MAEALAAKSPAKATRAEVLQIKSLIRWSEAKAGAVVAGCREEHLHFLDLPFYRTGTIAKKPLTDEDVAIVRALIEQVQPAQIYVAGDLSDPHGTHRVCAEAIFRAVTELERDTGSRPEVLLYRGAWQEWAPHEIEIAVPLSPRDLRQKRQAIFMHESQKDSALFPGPDDPREFWQRAEDRNRNTAAVYNQFGLPEYFALEGFVRWNGVAAVSSGGPQPPAQPSGLGGCLPYLASYWAANLASSSGWQTKHCESGRSCSAHQSPFFWNSAASFELHSAQTSSGTPCSLHHQPPCVCSSVGRAPPCSAASSLGSAVDSAQPTSSAAKSMAVAAAARFIVIRCMKTLPVEKTQLRHSLPTSLVVRRRRPAEVFRLPVRRPC